MTNPYYDDKELLPHLMQKGKTGLAGEVGKIHRKLMRGFDLAHLDIISGGGGGSTVSYTANAAVPLGGHRVLRLNGSGELIYASAGVLADAHASLGISMNAAGMGGSVVVRNEGTATEPSWSWTPGLPVFCGLSGLLTQTFSPSWAFSRIMGVALTATSIWVHPQPPIIL